MGEIKFMKLNFFQNILKYPRESKFIYNPVQKEENVMVEIIPMKLKFFYRKGSNTLENQNEAN
jgi:hypothetical protein